MNFLQAESSPLKQHAFLRCPGRNSNLQFVLRLRTYTQNYITMYKDTQIYQSANRKALLRELLPHVSDDTLKLILTAYSNEWMSSTCKDVPLAVDICINGGEVYPLENALRWGDLDYIRALLTEFGDACRFNNDWFRRILIRHSNPMPILRLLQEFGHVPGQFAEGPHRQVWLLCIAAYRGVECYEYIRQYIPTPFKSIEAAKEYAKHPSGMSDISTCLGLANGYILQKDIFWLSYDAALRLHRQDRIHFKDIFMCTDFLRFMPYEEQHAKLVAMCGYDAWIAYTS